MSKIDISLVSDLISQQFPQWKELPITEVVPNGWDNRTFRLGREMHGFRVGKYTQLRWQKSKNGCRT